MECAASLLIVTIIGASKSVNHQAQEKQDLNSAVMFRACTICSLYQSETRWPFFTSRCRYLIPLQNSKTLSEASPCLESFKCLARIDHTWHSHHKENRELPWPMAGY